MNTVKIGGEEGLLPNIISCQLSTADKKIWAISVNWMFHGNPSRMWPTTLK